MRKHARNIAAALLCACLLLFQAPFSGLFAQGSSPHAWANNPVASVSKEYGTSTQVRLAVSGFWLFCTEDFAAVVDDIALKKNDAGDPLYDLKAVTKGGYEPFSYQWSRSVDGGEPVDIPGATSSTYALSEAAQANLVGIQQPFELLEEGVVYKYICTATDGKGNTASASVTVAIVSEDDYSLRTLTDKDTDVSTTGYFHNSTELDAPDIPETAPIYAQLQDMAQGKALAGAWQLGVGGSGAFPPYLGSLEVSLPAPGLEDGTQVTVVGVDSAGNAVSYDLTVQDGVVRFETELLGAYAIAYTPTVETFSITASAGKGGTIIPIGTTEYVEGSSATYVIMPNSGYQLKALTVDGQPASILGNSYTFEDIRANHTIHAEFEYVQPDPNVTFSVKARVDGGDGKVSLNGSEPAQSIEVEATKGSEVQVTFVPDAGYMIDKVTINGVEVTVVGDTFYLTAVTADTEIVATFKAGISPPVPTFTITPQVEGAGGSISPSEPFEVPLAGRATFLFMPDEGYELDKVTVDGVEVEVSGLAYMLENIQASHVVTATFKVASGQGGAGDSFIITVDDKVAHGSISPSGDIAVQRGDDLTVYFTPDAGYAVSAIIVDGKRIPWTANSYTFVNVQEGHTISVEFTPAKAAGGIAQTGDDRGMAVMLLALIALAAALIAKRTVYREI